MLVRQLLAMRGVDPTRIDAAIVASVVPSLTETMVDLVRRAFGREALVVGPGIKTGMAILYENPREVGADRIVNAVAAYERAKGGVIVVDFGTATTFDCVTPKGEYLGGVIAPGVQISADALFSRAAKLPRVEIALPAAGRRAQHGALDAVGHRLRLRRPRRRPRRAPQEGARLPLPRRRDRRASRGSSRRCRGRSSEVDDDLTLTGPAHPLRAQRARRALEGAAAPPPRRRAPSA